MDRAFLFHGNYPGPTERMKVTPVDHMLDLFCVPLKAFLSGNNLGSVRKGMCGNHEYHQPVDSQS